MEKILTVDELQKQENFTPLSYFDLRKITKKELMSKYVDFSFIAKNQGFGKNVLVTNKEILSERKYYTAVYETVKSTLQGKYGFDDWQIKEDCVANNVKIIILFVDFKRNKDIMVAEMQSLGWCESISEKIIFYGVPVIAISFDPIYQMSITDEARSFKFLYHWTPSYNIKEILKRGLLPKKENSLYNYPPRVHLIKGNVIDENKVYIGWQLCQLNDNSMNNGEYTLFQIETKLIPTNVAFYYDPRYEYGYYTKRKIPVNALKIIGNIIYKKEKTYTPIYHITYL